MPSCVQLFPIYIINNSTDHKPINEIKTKNSLKESILYVNY